MQNSLVDVPKMAKRYPFSLSVPGKSALASVSANDYVAVAIQEEAGSDNCLSVWLKVIRRDGVSFRGRRVGSSLNEQSSEIVFKEKHIIDVMRSEPGIDPVAPYKASCRVSSKVLDGETPSCALRVEQGTYSGKWLILAGTEDPVDLVGGGTGVQGATLGSVANEHREWAQWLVREDLDTVVRLSNGKLIGFKEDGFAIANPDGV